MPREITPRSFVTILRGRPLAGGAPVLEGVLTQKRRRVEEELKAAKNKMNVMESQLSALDVTSALVSETPLQRAIQVVRQLQSEQPELHGTLQEVLSNLLSRDVLAPVLFNDESRLSSMDQFTRDLLGGATGLVEQPRPAGSGNGPASPSALAYPPIASSFHAVASPRIGVHTHLDGSRRRSSGLVGAAIESVRYCGLAALAVSRTDQQRTQEAAVEGFEAEAYSDWMPDPNSPKGAPSRPAARARVPRAPRAVSGRD